jgi:hypothetical protein
LIAPLGDATGYSLVMLHGLQDLVHTDYALIVQYDGFIWKPAAWNPAFLSVDYIGAPWSYQGDPRFAVGNGGFSLRSRRLLRALQDPAITFIHPEDVAICIKHRAYLESHAGIRFADRSLAERFAVESGAPLESSALPASFGFHGLHNLASILDGDQLAAVVAMLPDTLLASPRMFDLAFRYLVRGHGAIAAWLARAVRARVPDGRSAASLERLLAYVD